MWNRLEDILKLMPDNQIIEIRVIDKDIHGCSVYATTFEGYVSEARPLSRRGNYPKCIVRSMFSYNDPDIDEDIICLELLGGGYN